MITRLMLESCSDDGKVKANSNFFGPLENRKQCTRLSNILLFHDDGTGASADKA